MARKLPGKQASVGKPKAMGPKLPPVPTSPVNQPVMKMPKPKKPVGPMPSSGMPAQMGNPGMAGGPTPPPMGGPGAPPGL